MTTSRYPLWEADSRPREGGLLLASRIHLLDTASADYFPTRRGANFSPLRGNLLLYKTAETAFSTRGDLILDKTMGDYCATDAWETYCSRRGILILDTTTGGIFATHAKQAYISQSGKLLRDTTMGGIFATQRKKRTSRIVETYFPIPSRMTTSRYTCGGGLLLTARRPTSRYDAGKLLLDDTARNLPLASMQRTSRYNAGRLLCARRKKNTSRRTAADSR